MKRGAFYLLITFLAPYVYVNSQRINRIPPEKPKLILMLIVDQMRYDYLSRFGDRIGEGGIKKLIDEGTLCTHANYNYLLHQSGVGEATIATGTNPINHGIVSQNWFVRLKNEEVENTLDEDYQTIGSDSNEGKRSPQYLSSTTLGDELRLSNDFNSKVFGVALDPASAILSSGHTANCAYWFDDKSGNWITSSYYADSLPQWVKGFNEKKLHETYLQNEWNLLKISEEYQTCLPDDNDYEIGIKRNKTFPYDLYDISNLKKRKPDYSIIRYTPYGNLLTKDFVISLILNEDLGQDMHTDYLAVGFNATEYVGGRFGPKSVEIQDMILRFDQQLEHLLTFLDDHLGKENFMVVLTSNHGVSDIPDYLTDVKIPAGYFNSRSSVSLLKSYLNVIYGKGKWIRYYKDHQVFLNHTLIEDSDIKLAEMQTKVSQFLIQFSGVANTVTSTTLETTNFTFGNLHKIQNSFNQQRSGDVIINLKPGWIEKSNKCVDSNAPYSYITHVPLIWYGWKVGHEIVTDPVDMVDIATTLSSMLEISYPNANTGKPIHQLMK